MRSLFPLPLIVLAACADITDRSDGNVTWDAYPKHQALPAKWVQCETMPAGCYRDNFYTHACAVRNYTLGLCFIYSPDSLWQAQAGDIKHEMKHCEGYDHNEPIEMPNVSIR